MGHKKRISNLTFRAVAAMAALSMLSAFLVVAGGAVAGRLASVSGGHVWAEACIEGKGWVSVDTTSDHVGADANYLPFFATADGAMPILYVTTPTVEEM